jgi:hypothetical protein
VWTIAASRQSILALSRIADGEAVIKAKMDRMRRFSAAALRIAAGALASQTARTTTRTPHDGME